MPLKTEFQIPIVGGHFAVVDKEDYELLSKYRWYLIKGYALRKTFTSKNRTKFISMHREIMCPPPGQIIDHIDRNRLNNSKSNLRFATQSQNINNSIRTRKLVSGYRGVYPLNKKWRAMIKTDGKFRHIGTFRTPIEAARAYDIEARKAFGDFATTNL